MGVRKDVSENGTEVHSHDRGSLNGDTVKSQGPDGQDTLTVYKRIKELPSFRELNKQVQAVVAASSWWDRHGWEWVSVLVAVLLVPVGFWLLASHRYVVILSGMFLMGGIHGVLTTKSGHLSAHGALVESGPWNQLWTRVLVSFLGAYSSEMGYEIHIRVHHPHTNIIGLGDSSTWRVPFLPRYVYMFLAPFAVPTITPFVAIQQLLESKLYVELAKTLPLILCGLIGNAAVLVHYCGYTWPTAFLIMAISRATVSCPYVHINIFQHIGLPMYSRDHRPQRVYQMASGVLNLRRNIILDTVFGYSITCCHVEHHLFPKLSDNMCLKVQPIVSKFLKEHGLPYNEDTYWNKLGQFLDKYTELMVNAPPITHFVGLQ